MTTERTTYEEPPQSGEPGDLYPGVISSDEDFAGLKGDWDDLYARSGATPFQSWAWLYSWWEHYGENAALRLLTLRESGGRGRLVAILPAMIERPGTPLATLRLIGDGISDYLDGLAESGLEDEAALEIARSLAGLGGWNLAVFDEARPEAFTRRVAAAWSGHRRLMHGVNCPVLRVRPFDEIVAGVSKNLKKTTKKAISRAKRAGVGVSLVEGTEEQARRWVALHRESWSGKEIIAEHMSDRFEDCMVAAVARMSSAGVAALSEFSADGAVFGSHLLVFGDDFVGEYLYGTTTEALAKYQMSTLYIKDVIEVAQDRGLARASLLRGEEPYKMRWPVESVPNVRILLAKNRPTLAAYSTYLDLRGWYSRNTPENLKAIVNRFRNN